MSALTAAQLHIAPQDVIVASTGVIGQPLDLTPIRSGLPQLAAALGDHSDQAAEGIMTTDTHPKEIAVQFTAGGRTCTIGGIAKGSGMIHPNLATMLVFLTTDCAVSPADAAGRALRRRAATRSTWSASTATRPRTTWSPCWQTASPAMPRSPRPARTSRRFAARSTA